MQIQTQFYIGEKDGARPRIEVPALPRLGTIIYTWRTQDDQRIQELSHKPDRQKALIEQVSILAYRFIGDVIEREGPPGMKIIKEYRFILAYRFIGDVIEREGPPGMKIIKEYRFSRYEAADKVAHDPVV